MAKKLESASKTAHRTTAPESSNALEAAKAGWGTTVRYGLLRLLQPGPLAAGGTAGALSTLAAAYARAQGWL